MEKEKDTTVAVDKDTRKALRIMSAMSSKSIKQILKEIVKKEKARKTLSPAAEFYSD